MREYKTEPQVAEPDHSNARDPLTHDMLSSRIRDDMYVPYTVSLDRLSLNLRIPEGKQHQTLISPPNCLERNYEHCILTLSRTCRSLLVAVDGDDDTSHKLVAAQSGASSVDVPLFRTPTITGSPCSGSISTDVVINHGNAALPHQKSARLVQRTRGDQACCESGQQKKRAPVHIVTVRRKWSKA